MVAGHGARRSLAPLTRLLAATLVSGACAGASTSLAPSATVAPAATPTAVPTPSPTPVDVPAAFVKRIIAPNFSATAVVTGELAIGAVEGSISGKGAFSGPNSSMSLSIVAGGVTQDTETVTVGSSSWSRAAPGPWLEDPPKPAGSTDSSLGEVLRSVVSVVDLGVESRGGRQLHHLRSSSGNSISGDAVGFGSATTKDGKFTLDFYAADDGTPAIMAIAGTWTQVNGTVEVPSSMSFDIAFDDIGDPQVIEPPGDVWVRYTSKALGYTMAHPEDWTVEAEKDQDTYMLNGQGYVYVATQPYKGSTTTFAAELKADQKTQLKADPASEVPTTLGRVPAVRLAYEITGENGQPVTFVDDVASRDGTGWEVYLVVEGGPEAIDTFDTFVATFAFTR